MLPWEEFGGMTCQILLLSGMPGNSFPWSRFLSSLRDCEVGQFAASSDLFLGILVNTGALGKEFTSMSYAVSHGINVRQGLDYPMFRVNQSFQDQVDPGCMVCNRFFYHVFIFSFRFVVKLPTGKPIFSTNPLAE